MPCILGQCRALEMIGLGLRVLVDAARARLAELETACTIDKARVDSLQASLFQRL